MRKITTFCFALLALCFVHGAFAQQAAKAADTAKAPEPAAHYFHLDFVVQEVNKDGKPVNSRSYATTVRTEGHDLVQIRTNSKVPVAIGANPADKENPQFQYQNIAVRIDARDAHEIGGQLALNLSASVNSVAASSDPNLHQSVFRDNDWQATVLIPIGKPTVAFMSDTLDSKGSMQLVVTAAPL
jgi:hypothetical protein